jgi:hypothetical protein
MKYFYKLTIIIKGNIIPQQDNGGDDTNHINNKITICNMFICKQLANSDATIIRMHDHLFPEHT